MKKNIFLPILPYTFTKSRAIVSMHSSVEELYSIIVNDPSLYINLVSIVLPQKELYNIKDVISFLGLKKIVKYIEQFPIFSLSKIIEFKKLFDVIEKINYLKKSLIILEYFYKYKLVNKYSYTFAYILKEWQNFFAINNTPVHFIKNNFEICEFEYRKFLVDMFGEKLVEHLFLIKLSLSTLINNFINNNKDSIVTNKILLNYASPQQINSIYNEINKELSKIKKVVFDNSDIIEYTLLVEERNIFLLKELNKFNEFSKNLKNSLNLLELIEEIIKTHKENANIAILFNKIKSKIEKISSLLKINDTWVLYVNNQMLKVEQSRIEKTVDLLNNYNSGLIVKEDLEKLLKETIFKGNLNKDANYYLISIPLDNFYQLIEFDKESDEYIITIYSILDFAIKFYFENVRSNSFVNHEINIEIDKRKNDVVLSRLLNGIEQYRQLLNKYSNLDDYRFEDVVNILNLIRESFTKLVLIK